MHWRDDKIKILVMETDLLSKFQCPGGLVWPKRLLGISRSGANEQEIAGSNPARGSKFAMFSTIFKMILTMN